VKKGTKKGKRTPYTSEALLPVIVYRISYSILARLSLSFEAIITLFFALALSLSLRLFIGSLQPLALPFEIASKS